MGKGDKPRPILDRGQYDKNWSRIFNDDWPVCKECNARFIFDPFEPFAFCECGITEWPDSGRPENYKQRQKEFENEQI